jgi:hypothetical protein
MLEDAFQKKNINKAVHLTHNLLYTTGYIKTSQALASLPTDQRLWQRQNGVLPKALKQISKTFSYDVYGVVQDIESGYGIVQSCPSIRAETLGIDGFEGHPTLTYTIGLSETVRAPEFVVSGLEPKDAHELLTNLVEYLVQKTYIDLGEPLTLYGKKLLFKQFDPNLQMLMPILQWYNSFEPVHTCQVLWTPYPWNEGTQKLYWSCPFKYAYPNPKHHP